MQRSIDSFCRGKDEDVITQPTIEPNLDKAYSTSKIFMIWWISI